MKTFTRQDIAELIESIGGRILDNGDDYIEATSNYSWNTLWFQFDENGILIGIGC